MLTCNLQKTIRLMTIVLTILISCPAYAEFPKFRYHLIDKIGNQMGQTSLVDIDKDGDLDWIVGCNAGDIWWFEYKGPDNWTRHLLGQNVLTEVGGTAFDVDGDGWIDQVSGGTWFRNPGNPRQQQFVKYTNGIIPNSHDNIAADIDGDKKPDIVAMSDRSGLFWYKIPADPNQKWIEFKIGPPVHGGIDPKGAGDIDGDGDTDIVRSNVWFENQDGKGTKWIEHKNIDFGQPDAKFPFMTKIHVVDLDKDGDIDIVQAEGDCESGRIAWHENVDGKGQKWIRHIIADKTGQDYHSLALADFDNDGDLDIYSGSGPFTKGTRKSVIWENKDGKGGDWVIHEILVGKYCHEAKAGDVDGDGDIDICTKPWVGDEHIYLRNLLKESSQ